MRDIGALGTAGNIFLEKATSFYFSRFRHRYLVHMYELFRHPEFRKLLLTNPFYFIQIHILRDEYSHFPKLFILLLRYHKRRLEKWAEFILHLLYLDFHTAGTDYKIFPALDTKGNPMATP